MLVNSRQALGTQPSPFMPKTAVRARPSVANAYPLLLMEIVAERGFEPADALAAVGLSPKALQRSGACISPTQYTLLTLHAAKITGDPGIGCELGLRMRHSTHGFVGYAAMTAGTLREAIMLSLRFARLRQRNIGMSFWVDAAAQQGVIELRELVPIGPVRHFFLEGMLVGLARGMSNLVGMPQQAMELWFETPQPAHYARYRSRLPPVRFAQPRTQLRFPAAYLDQPTTQADPPASTQAAEQCERELALLGEADGDEDLAARVCAELARRIDAPPSLHEVASRLCMSGRTLTRKLQGCGTRFQALADETRQRHAQQMLGRDELDLQSIAAALGFADPANFTRAFKRWTGCSPSLYRESLRALRR